MNKTISARDFHSVYQNFTSSFINPDIEKINEVLPNLLLSQEDEKIIQAIKEISEILKRPERHDKDDAIKELKPFSPIMKTTSIRFWHEFSMLEFETKEQVKALFLDRIKTLQKELQTHGVTDRVSLA
jgi:hypothetical protein